MAFAWVEEYESIGQLGGPALIQAPAGPPTAVQKVEYTATSGITAVKLDDSTKLIIVSCDTDANWRLCSADDEQADDEDMTLFAGTYRPMVISGRRDRWVAFVEL